MTVPFFIDTNALIYAASRRSSERSKKTRAQKILASDQFGVSGQVLAEFYSTVTRNGDPLMAASDALAWNELLECQMCASMDASIVKRGAEISETCRISYWDGAIVAAAETLGAPILYTEDLNDGQVYGNVRAVNPFAPPSN